MLTSSLRDQFFGVISSPLVRSEEIASSTSSTETITVEKHYYTDQILILIKNYTVVAHRSFKDEATRMGGSQLDLNGADINLSHNGAGRKGQVVNAPQKQWLGFGVLWQLVNNFLENIFI